MESPWYFVGGLAAAAFFGVMMWLMVGPLPGVLGFVFILGVALAPMLRRR